MINLDKKRPPLYLLTGVLLGIALGLAVAWWFVPVQVVDTHPLSLRTDFKDAYRALIASAYVANGDLGRAQARLALLGDTDPARALASQAQVILSQDGSEQSARALGLLAAALGEQLPAPLATGAAASPTGSVSPDSTAASAQPSTQPSTLPSSATLTPRLSASPDLSRTPPATKPPTPTVTPTPTQGAPFVVESFMEVCDLNLPLPLIQVYVYDAARRPLPGIEVLVTWDAGEDHFFTGLQPNLGLEYADFEMTPGVLYTVNLTDGEQPLAGVTARECEAAGGIRHLSSWKIIFIQP